jgi:hypothetical protein
VSDELDRYYLILGLEPGAPAEDVRQAYRDCVEAWHPDRFAHSPERQQRAQARMKQINEAYQRLRQLPPRPGSGPPPGEAPREQPRSTGHQASSRSASGAGGTTTSSRSQAGGRTSQRARPAEPPEPPETPSRPWLELANESRFTVTALYFSALSVIVAAGCGVTLGGIHAGPVGAVSGLLASPLAGVATGTFTAGVSCLVAPLVRDGQGDSVGGAIGYLLPGAAVGVAIVWSIFHVLVGANHLHPLHLVFGGACGGGLGAALGAWTGKAVAEARSGAGAHSEPEQQ